MDRQQTLTSTTIITAHEDQTRAFCQTLYFIVLEDTITVTIITMTMTIIEDRGVTRTIEAGERQQKLRILRIKFPAKRKNYQQVLSLVKFLLKLLKF